MANIERIRLKNGDEYPVSPAYREPAVSGDFEFPISYDGSADTPDGTIVLAAANLTLPVVRFTDEVLTAAQLRKLSLDAAGQGVNTDTAVAQYDGPVWDNVLNTDLNAVLSLLVSTMMGAPVTVSVAGLTADCAVLDGDLLCAAIAFPSGGTWTDSTLGISVTASGAGTYLALVTVDAASCTLEGTLTAAEYVFDERYAPGQYVRVISGVIYTQLLAAGSLDLTAYPNISARLEAAGAHAVPLQFGHPGRAALLTQFQRDMAESGGIWTTTVYSWTNGATTLTYTIATKTLTMTTS